MSFRKTVLVVATTNPGKAREIRAALRGLPVRVLSAAEAGLRKAPPERGTTFEENARAKSLFYSRRTPHLTLAEDSGLEVAALGGRPGVRSARFSGRGATDARNVERVLRLLKGVPPSRRRARFVCRMVLSREGRVLKSAGGDVRGTIAQEPRGRGGFGYDPIFYYHPLRRTFAEISGWRKNAVSHRGRALARMRRFLETTLGGRASVPRH